MPGNEATAEPVAITMFLDVIFVLLLFVGFFYLLFKSLDQFREKTKNFAQIFSHTGFSLLLISILNLLG